MRNLIAITLAALLLLVGCASIPLSTMLRLSALEPNKLAQVDPGEVRVRVSIPEAYELNVPESRLTLALSTEGGEERNARMGLSLLQQTREQRSAGLFAGNLSVSTYVLALTPEGAQQMRSMQQFLLTGNPNEVTFGIRAPLSEAPAKGAEMTLWADVKLSREDPYMTLIDAARIKFESDPDGS